jgi:hypothetical protein
VRFHPGHLRILAALALALAVAAAHPGGADPVPDRNAIRAGAAYRAMQRVFYRQDRRVYRESVPGRRPATAWSFSQALAATIAMANLPERGGAFHADVRDRLLALARYWNPSSAPPGYDSLLRPPAGKGGGAQFYDDNEWIGIELLGASRLLGPSRLGRGSLLRAQQLFALVVGGWDSEPSHPCPGGVFWTRDASVGHRNTVSTANGAILALSLYLKTGRPDALSWGRRMVAWVDRCLAARDGLYFDHIDLQGAIDATRWSYNQGAMIAANLLLYRISGEARYLARAEAVADAALAYLAPVIDREPPEFVAIFFHDLLLLDETAPERHYADAVQGYADATWLRRDARTGLFRFPGRATVSLLQQAAMARIYADLAASDPRRTAAR